MIISRAPFRVSFSGGGSDLPSFYETYGGCALSTTIKKYIYICAHPYFYGDSIVLKYSKTEIANNFDEVEHRIFRQCLKDFDIKGIEISSMADAPSGTGLGSSSAFTVALLHLLYTYKGNFVSKYKIAKEACIVEIEKLGEPIGKQDQFASAFGGLNYYEFKPDGFVKVEPVIMKKESYRLLEDNLLLFHTGNVRSASRILSEQSENMKNPDKAKIQLKMCEIARSLRGELQNNNIGAMGELLHEGWTLKKEMAQGITNALIEDAYETAIKAGASGGKLLGAGGGGFLLFYVEDAYKSAVRNALSSLRELDFELDNSGTSIIHIE